MKKVALALGFNSEFDRKIAAGVADYAIQSGWSVYIEDNPDLRLPRLTQWNGDGVITNFDASEVRRWLKHGKLPMICVGGGFADNAANILKRTHRVMTDDEEIGRLAAEHLLGRDLRHLAFCDYGSDSNAGWSTLRGKAFGRTARRAGASFDHFQPRVIDPRKWNAMLEEIAAWIRARPRPLGILAADDQRAHHVLEAARRAEIDIPGQLAVMGVDNDSLPCRLSQPPLTSIDPNAEFIGYLAAQRLDLLIDGENVPLKHRVPPLKVVQRRSTGIYIDSDALVEKAMSLAGPRIADGIQAGEVAAACTVSLVTLNKRFRKSRGKTLSEWIRRRRLDIIRQLVEETNLPLQDVAARSGVSSASYLCSIYRANFGCSPRRGSRM